MYYLGIDVHKDESYVAVLDDDGMVDQEFRVDNKELDGVAEEYSGSKAAIEATGNYYTVYDTLDEYLDVVVADPQQTKAIGTAEVKNDRLDAKLLGQLRKADMVAESYVPEEDIREQRTLVRTRKKLVEKRTDFKNEVHSVLDKEGISYSWDPFSVAGREKIESDGLGINEVNQTLLESFFDVIDELTCQIKKLEKVIQDTDDCTRDKLLLFLNDHGGNW